MVSTPTFLFKDRDGQTPLPPELFKGLKIKSIQSMGELDEHEERNIAKGLSWLARSKEDPKKYDFWLKAHKKLFSDVWSWAGSIRKVELQNPDFLMPYDIWPALYQLEKDLAAWLEFKSFPAEMIAARFHERIETIHPFPNGNGRLGRIITEQHFQQIKKLKSVLSKKSLPITVFQTLINKIFYNTPKPKRRQKTWY